MNNSKMNFSELVEDSLRISPNLIVVGECKGSEVFDAIGSGSSVVVEASHEVYASKQYPNRNIVACND